MKFFRGGAVKDSTLEIAASATLSMDRTLPTTILLVYPQEVSRVERRARYRRIPQDTTLMIYTNIHDVSRSHRAYGLQSVKRP